MKKKMLFSCAVLFLVFASSNAQTESSLLKDSIDFQYQKQSVFDNCNFSNLNYTHQQFFQIYNEGSLLNDVYGSNKGVYFYAKSIFVPENVNKGMKKDSFNPLGANDVQTGFMSGTLNLILDKLQ